MVKTNSSFRSAVLLICMLLTVLAVVPGCTSKQAPIPNQIILDPYVAGNNQTGKHGAELSKSLQVVVEGPQEPGLLGGKGSRRAVPNTTVLFKINDPGDGTVFTENNQTELEVLTGVAGTANVQLKLGMHSGDVTVKASLPKYPDIKAVTFRASVGLERIGKDLEGITGTTLEEFGVRLFNPDGSPAKGVEVHFATKGDTQKASVKSKMKLTDKNGEATTSWKLGSKVKQYFATVEIRDDRDGIEDNARFVMHALDFKAMAINKKTMAIGLFGGLALFIFGMKLMSDGLQKIADRRLKQILGFMTRNRFLAACAGMGITAMVQSSSATSVMTVGFVNAGLMSLAQAIGVVFGANVGTTITAQIIAFKLNDLAYPAIAIGMLLMMISKRQRVKFLGETILGFGLLFLGMSTMSGILKPLKDSPEFISYFQLFDCRPLLEGGMVQAGPALMCIVIGAITTCVIQSSSATVGLILALASQGLLSFYAAVPLMLGSNIGTTITANLAAIGTNRNARRTALAHTLFNVFGAVYMYGLLFLPWWNGQPVFLGLVNAITAGDVFAKHPENLVRHIANAHSTFNIFNCLLFLPFVNIMARVCERIIPITDADKKTVLQYLEPHLLKTPAFALRQAAHEIAYMVRQGQKSTNEACAMLIENKKNLETKIIEREHLIDQLQHDIAEYLVQLSRTDLNAEQASLMPKLLHAVNDAERLGDHAEEMMGLRHVLKEHSIKMSPAELEELTKLQNKLNEQFDNLFAILEKGEEGIPKINACREQFDRMIRLYTDANVKRIDEGTCDVQAGVVYLDALTHMERAGGHLVNIAQRSQEVVAITGPVGNTQL